MTPYYADELVTIYNARCEDVLPSIDPADVDLLLTDPPYGINLDPDYTRRTFGGGTRAPSGYQRIEGDDAEFDPRPLFRYEPCILFGANNFAPLLPVGGWIVWDKREQTPSNQLADVELAWCSKRGPARIFRHYWNGPVRSTERGFHVHPTQKPVALMRWIVDRWTDPGGLVLDPYMGSGPVAQACHELGRRYIGIELAEEYCKVAVSRLSQQTLDLEGGAA